MVLPPITGSPRAPNILRYQDRGGAELHLIELPFKRIPRTSALRRSANFAQTAF
jgi:hypothetical protein